MKTYIAPTNDLRRYATDGLPTMRTRASADGHSWWFICPVCNERHAHGAAGGAGARASHCRDRGAFPTGYYIEAPDNGTEAA